MLGLCKMVQGVPGFVFVGNTGVTRVVGVVEGGHWGCGGALGVT
jgi:hypothetical protein